MAPTHILDANRAKSRLLAVRGALSKLSHSASASTALQRRQNNNIIPTSYIGIKGDTAPGTVIGIVVGAVFGFLLLAMLLWWAAYGTYGANVGDTTEEIVEVRRHPRSRSPRSRRSRRSSGYVDEIRHVSRSRSPRRRSQIVEERIVTEERFPMPGPPPLRPRSRSPRGMRETIIVEDRSRRHSGDDEVIVIEEESDLSSIPPPRRHRSKRSNGYRQADLERYGGEDYERQYVDTRDY
jgi:hypothetical protein